MEELTLLEHIRLKPEMYVGDLSNGNDMNSGIYKMLRLVLDDWAQKYHQGLLNEIEIYLDKNSVGLGENSSGMSLKELIESSEVISHCGIGESMEKPYTSLSIVNALSRMFYITSYQEDGESHEVMYIEGKQVSTKSKPESRGILPGITLTFIPDKVIFPNVIFDYKMVSEIIRGYRTSCPHLKINLFNQTQE